MALCNDLLDVFESADAGMAKSNTHPVIGDFADNKASAPHDSINGATDLLAVVNFANDNDTQAQARRFFSECMTTDDGEVGDMPASEFFTTHAESSNGAIASDKIRVDASITEFLVWLKSIHGIPDEELDSHFNQADHMKVDPTGMVSTAASVYAYTEDFIRGCLPNSKRS